MLDYRSIILKKNWKEAKKTQGIVWTNHIEDFFCMALMGKVKLFSSVFPVPSRKVLILATQNLIVFFATLRISWDPPTIRCPPRVLCGISSHHLEDHPRTDGYVDNNHGDRICPLRIGLWDIFFWVVKHLQLASCYTSWCEWKGVIWIWRGVSKIPS